MSLTRVLEEIKQYQVYADEDVDSGPSETMSGRRGRKMQAQESIKRLKRDYGKDLMASSLFILISGANRDAFTSTAIENFGCFAADPEGFYRELADSVAPVLYENKMPSSSMFDVLGRHLEDKALEMDIVGYPQLLFRQQYLQNITSKESFVSLVKTAINEQVGGEVAGIHAVRAIVDSAIARSHSARVTPIVMGTKDDQLVVELFHSLKRLTPNVFLVVAGKAPRFIKNLSGALVIKEATPQSVEETLTTIKNSVRK